MIPESELRLISLWTTPTTHGHPYSYSKHVDIYMYLYLGLRRFCQQIFFEKKEAKSKEQNSREIG